MKHLIITIIALLAFNLLYAQTPNEFKYQAVLRNQDGSIIQNKNTSVVISILKSDLTTYVFNETHEVTPNDYGLININVGSNSDLSTIDWGADTYFIEIKVNGTVVGTNQLLSVPYALHSKSSESLTGSIDEKDPIFKNSTAADISSEDLNKLDNLSGINTGDQDLTDYTKLDVLADTAAKLRASIPNVEVFLTTEVDGSVSNEIQTISRSGLVVNLSNGGGTYTDSINTYSAGDHISISNNTISVNPYSIFPAGGIISYAGSEAPEGWLICDGSEVDRTFYATLFGAIGTSYGAGDGSTTFNLPNLQNKIPVGKSDEINFQTLGQTGGSSTNTISIDNMPAHSHTAYTDGAGNHSHTGTAKTGGRHDHTGRTTTWGSHEHTYNRHQIGTMNGAGFVNTAMTGKYPQPTTGGGGHMHDLKTWESGEHTHSIVTSTDGLHAHAVYLQNTGSGQEINNLQPYVVTNYIIKY